MTAAWATVLRARLAEMKRERDECDEAARRWNRQHPDQAPLPERDADVDRVIDECEAHLNNGRYPV